MKNFALIAIYVVCAFALLAGACNTNTKSPENKKLQGKWKSKDGETALEIDAKKFTLDNGEPIPEDYFLKGDTILTSFEGNQPYTKFVIQKLDDHQLNLLFPDSVTVEFTR